MCRCAIQNWKLFNYRPVYFVSKGTLPLHLNASEHLEKICAQKKIKLVLWVAIADRTLLVKRRNLQRKREKGHICEKYGLSNVSEKSVQKNYRLTSLEYSQCAYRVFKIEGQRTKQVLLTGLNWKIVSTTESRNLPRHDVGFSERDPHWTNAADCWSLASDVSICRSPGKVTENYSCLNTFHYRRFIDA